MIEIEILNQHNEEEVKKLHTDKNDDEFVYEVSYTINLSKYIKTNSIKGNCYAIKFDDTYVGIVLICEVINNEANISILF